MESINNQPLIYMGLNDLATYCQSDFLSYVLNKYRTKSSINIIEAMELLEAIKFIQHDIFPEGYNSQQIILIKNQLPELNTLAKKAFIELTEEDLYKYLPEIPSDYRRFFLSKIAEYAIQNRCNQKALLENLLSASFTIPDLCTNKTFVKLYKNEIAHEFLNNPRLAELVIRKFLTDENFELLLPHSLTSSDYSEIFKRYIEFPQANLHFVRLLELAAPNNKIGIDGRIKLLAKNRAIELTNQHFSPDSFIHFRAEVHFSSEADQQAVKKFEDKTLIQTYSTAWLNNTLEYSSILNNIQNLFGFADLFALLTLPSYHTEIGQLEGLIQSNGRDHYTRGIAFQLKDNLSSLQTIHYINFLKLHDIHLEEVISWYFEKNIKDEFGIDGFSFNPSTPTSNYLERARHLFAELESLCNQFNCLAQEGSIQTDFISLSYVQTKFHEIPSLTEPKYVYPKDDKLCYLLAILFDKNVNWLGEDPSVRKDLFEYINLNDVSYVEILPQHRKLIDHLVENNLLEISDGILTKFSRSKAVFIYHLFHRNSAPLHWLDVDAMHFVDILLDSKLLSTKSTLLTFEESKYFNFYLNNVEFSDGPSLRNRYMHGAQGNNSQDHFSAYITVLKLILCLTIKINDDLIAKDGPQLAVFCRNCILI